MCVCRSLSGFVFWNMAGLDVCLKIVIGLLADTIAVNCRTLEDVQYHVGKLEYDGAKDGKREEADKENG